MNRYLFFEINLVDIILKISKFLLQKFFERKFMHSVKFRTAVKTEPKVSENCHTEILNSRKVSI